MESGHDRLMRRLESGGPLTAEDARAVRELPLKARRIPADAEVVREGDRPTDCCLVIEGFVVRQRTTPGGRRQIMSIHVPGDMPDLQSISLEVMDHTLATVSRATVAFVPHTALLELMRRHPRLAEALVRVALVDAAIHREWICNIGARSAYQRTAHLLCEFFIKMQVVGLTTGASCPFPLSQRDLGDCTGLSSVHVNRTLQQLRADGLIVLAHHVLTIPDLQALQAVGEFDPTYLHLKGPISRSYSASAGP